MKRKIVILGTSWPFRGGGIATYNERLARAFQAEGHEVVIYTFTLQYPGFLFPGKTQMSDQPAPEDLNILQKVNSVNPFNWIKVGRELKNRKADIVVIRYWIPFMAPCLGTIARIIRKNKVSRIIAIADNIIPHEKRPGDKAFTRYFVGSADAFITMSKSVLNDLNLFKPKAPKVYIPHPLYDNFGQSLTREEALKSLGLNPGYRYFLFFGFIRDYKGLDWLLEAFADNRIAGHPVKLIVAGEYYTDSAKYLELIKKYHMEDRIELRTDFIPDEDVAKYFCASDLVVQPYKSATQSGVTQISYHFEKPMLVTEVGGLGELIPDGKVGYVVKPNPSAIANALVDFLKSGKPDRFHNNIQEEKKKFSWQKMVQSIIKLANLPSK